MICEQLAMGRQGPCQVWGLQLRSEVCAGLGQWLLDQCSLTFLAIFLQLELFQIGMFRNQIKLNLNRTTRTLIAQFSLFRIGSHKHLGRITGSSALQPFYGFLWRRQESIHFSFMLLMFPQPVFYFITVVIFTSQTWKLFRGSLSSSICA